MGDLGAAGDGTLGFKDERRDTEGARGVSGASPRMEEFEGFRPSAGDAERLMLATLGLLRKALAENAGDDGVRCGAEIFLGEFGLGDGGSWVLAAAACSDRRLSEFVSRFASLFVDWRGGLSPGGCASLR